MPQGLLGSQRVDGIGVCDTPRREPAGQHAGRGRQGRGDAQGERSVRSNAGRRRVSARPLAADFETSQAPFAGRLAANACHVHTESPPASRALRARSVDPTGSIKGSLETACFPLKSDR